MVCYFDSAATLASTTLVQQPTYKKGETVGLFVSAAFKGEEKHDEYQMQIKDCKGAVRYYIERQDTRRWGTDIDLLVCKDIGCT